MDIVEQLRTGGCQDTLRPPCFTGRSQVVDQAEGETPWGAVLSHSSLLAREKWRINLNLETHFNAFHGQPGMIVFVLDPTLAPSDIN